MTHAVITIAAYSDRKPAAWLVAGGIVSAITVCASCLTILLH